MSRAKIYPGATQRRYSGVSGAAMPDVTKLVLHSTETSAAWGCPGYGGGGSAPTMTVCPWNKRVWQHFDANESAKALVDLASTSVRENRDNVAQIEIIGYSDQNIARTYGYNLRQLTQDGIDFIAKVIAWYHHEWNVPLKIPASWPMYPASYGSTSARMSGPQYDSYQGVLGHLHVPGNSHGDPALDIDALMSSARRIAGGGGPAPAPNTDPLEEIMGWYDNKSDFEKTMRGIVAHEAPRAEMKSHASLDGGVINENIAGAIRRDQTIGRQVRKKLNRIDKKLDKVIDALKKQPQAASGLAPIVFDIQADVAALDAQDEAEEQAAEATVEDEG